MWGFPLTVNRIRRQMHKQKVGFITMDEALIAARQHKLPTIYSCPFCSKLHISSHTWNPRYTIDRTVAELMRRPADGHR